MLVGVLVVVAAGLVWVASRHPGTEPARPSGFEGLGDGAPPVGHRAPDFSLPLLNGGTFSLHSVKGKPVVLNFWAAWCAPCRAETPMLVRLQKVYGPRGLQFVGVDSEDQIADARAFAAQYHVDYPLVRLDDERLIDAYAIPGLPTTVFIGADGIVVGKVVGGFVGPEGEKLLIARLDRLLAGAHR
ncbi:MAG TPA: TlpA disulfide reductase family protein [bacterium]|nr:TlpA disulfide reductase family protein [bacterium]